METLENSHILKFVIKGKPIRTDIGIKCMPQQTYGVSKQSPQHFKGTKTPFGDQGYIYQHENKPQFGHFSQKKYYSIDGSGQENYSQLYHQQRITNQLAFHRKKGRLSEFMDRNGWMSSVTPIMGFERTPEARELSNRDRNKRINSLKPKKKYENTLMKPKINKKYFETIPQLMSQKLRIRVKRNQLADLQVPTSSRTLFTPTIEQFEVQALKDKMIMTARDWGSTRSSFNPDVSLRLAKIKSGKQSPEDWYRTTCSSKWVYKKQPLKQDSEELEFS